MNTTEFKIGGKYWINDSAEDAAAGTVVEKDENSVTIRYFVPAVMYEYDEEFGDEEPEDQDWKVRYELVKDAEGNEKLILFQPDGSETILYPEPFEADNDYSDL